MYQCKGCVIYQATGGPGSCDIVAAGRQDKCPCRECVIKVMCRQTCDDLWDLVDNLYPNHTSGSRVSK